jgi:hypothetical protein
MGKSNEEEFLTTQLNKPKAETGMLFLLDPNLH